MSSNRRWAFIEGKEQFYIVVGLSISLILLVTMVVFLTISVIERENTLMQYEAERGFSSSTYLLLQQEHSRALAAMAESNVMGIGVYTNTGRLMLGLGSVPNILPLNKINPDVRTGSANQYGRGVATYNKETGMIEYIRYSRLTIQIETGDFMLEEDGLIPSPVLFPDVIYIVFDGQQYHQKVLWAKFFAVVASLAIFTFHLMVYSVYRNNREYRSRLVRQERLVNLGEAARTLAHEIKNPLSAITIQMALLRKQLPKQNVGDLAVIDQEVQRLIQLTNKVSEFLRNPLGTPEEIELISFIESLLPTFSTEVRLIAKNVRPAIVWFDMDRARSVFENLLKNAVESCSDRDPQVEVEITLDKKRIYHIFIRDRGDGIPEEISDKIFDPFFTTKIHGSGIGLAICRQFVRARGGNIKLYPREGGGTIVEVVLPQDRKAEVFHEDSHR
jgi:two-component system sensor histidine kinase HydH